MAVQNKTNTKKPVKDPIVQPGLAQTTDSVKPQEIIQKCLYHGLTNKKTKKKRPIKKSFIVR